MMEFQEFARIPVIDTHVHRVHPDRAPEFGNLGGGYIDGENQAYHGRQTLLYRMVMEELRKEFKMAEDVRASPAVPGGPAGVLPGADTGAEGVDVLPGGWKSPWRGQIFERGDRLF